jgi:hypothetical protein
MGLVIKIPKRVTVHTSTFMGRSPCAMDVDGCFRPEVKSFFSFPLPVRLLEPDARAGIYSVFSSSSKSSSSTSSALLGELPVKSEGPRESMSPSC